MSKYNKELSEGTPIDSGSIISVGDIEERGNDAFKSSERVMESLGLSASENETLGSFYIEDIVGLKNTKQLFIGGDTIKFNAWKNVLNVSARLIACYEEIVVLECLVDGNYEEWEFEKDGFDGYDLSIGNLFYLRYFKRDHEKRIEILNDPGMVRANDFPKMDYVKLFEKSSLFKK